MAEKPTSLETTLQIRRTFAAPRQKVFEAWTQLEKLPQWLCRVTQQHSTRILELDARVGGRYRLEVTTPEGSRMLLSGTYREVKSPEKLVFTWLWEGDPDFGETLVTVEFHAQGKSTEMSSRMSASRAPRDAIGTKWDGMAVSTD